MFDGEHSSSFSSAGVEDSPIEPPLRCRWQCIDHQVEIHRQWRCSAPLVDGALLAPFPRVWATTILPLCAFRRDPRGLRRVNTHTKVREEPIAAHALLRKRARQRKFLSSTTRSTIKIADIEAGDLPQHLGAHSLDGHRIFTAMFVGYRGAAPEHQPLEPRRSPRQSIITVPHSRPPCANAMPDALGRLGLTADTSGEPNYCFLIAALWSPPGMESGEPPPAAHHDIKPRRWQARWPPPVPCARRHAERAIGERCEHRKLDTRQAGIEPK